MSSLPYKIPLYEASIEFIRQNVWRQQRENKVYI